MATCFGRPRDHYQATFLQIVCLPCAYNMGSHDVYKHFFIKIKITVKIHCWIKTLVLECT